MKQKEREDVRIHTLLGWKLFLLVGLTAATLSLHYMLFPFPHWIHSLHRRLCYVPILLGGLWFGLPGGLAVAFVISAAVLPLALQFDGPLYNNQDMVEIIFYVSLGVLTGFLVDRREAERRRREDLQANLAESRRLAALGQMAAGIAHEIRTPLGSIQGAAEILGEDYPVGHPRRQFWEILLQETGRLGNVVRDFLDLGRPIAVRPREVAAREAVEGCFRSLSGQAEARKVRLASCVPEAADLLADPERLHQALSNLVLNAIQASPEGSTVTVSASADEEGTAITVEDEGPGLPPGEEDRLFEPFFSRRKDGTGLGLALVRQIAQAHGGGVEASAREDGGARVTLHLPAAPQRGGGRP